MPQVVFTHPEVAAVGLTEARAREAGLPVRVVRYDLGDVAGASLAAEGYRVRVYLPYGTEWYPYLTRRMAEKPANLLLFLRSVIGS